MLGEGARTAADAERYLHSYADAITAIGKSAGAGRLPNRPGISVKLSALHPRYDARHRDRVLKELTPRLVDLARAAKGYDLNLTIDAEEADRLELSLDIFAAALADRSLAGWDGFGLAVQAYQKRARAVIDWVAEAAAAWDRRLMVRLVKGAYWNTEIKRADERGLADFPVFTRKPATDLSYIVCAERMLAARPRLYQQFATHNALTVALIMERAENRDFEFQRLHGMGDALYRQVRADGYACRIYAPVGSHRELLAYLVRRLLENGANSSLSRSPPTRRCRCRNCCGVRSTSSAVPTMPRIPKSRCRAISTASGTIPAIEFGERAALSQLVSAIAAEKLPAPGSIPDTTKSAAGAAVSAARDGFKSWSRTPAGTRAAALQKAADLIEQRSAHFIALLQREGGKTLDDAISEVREAVDFCRYYAAQGRELFGEGKAMPGPTGESNILYLRGRGVFVAISPWNFPLAIFLGQVTAALMAGNTVVAKPAEQTPLIAAEAIRLLHEARVPASALHLVAGDGRIGGILVTHPDIAGVVFTGSTEVAQTINRALAAKDGPIVPLIAETGGINAMIVDATALPEQVADDVVTSAFRSAGQRCSALRLLFLQDDVADRMIEMIAGAARELVIGDPADPATHIGPVIDTEARQRLDAHIERMKKEARVHFAGSAPQGNYVAPHIFELSDAGQLAEEVFGPVLHVVRYRADRFDQVLQTVERSGYGLTLGIHSRIDDTVEDAIERLQVGNIYVNRNMIGAVVGVQPFGGHGLSGTGPRPAGRIIWRALQPSRR